MEAEQEGEKEEMKEEKVEQEIVEEEQKAKEKEEEALGRSREWTTSCDKSVICDRGRGLVRLGSSLEVVEERKGDEEMESRRRRKQGEKEKGELRQTRDGHRLSVVLPRQRARSPVTVQVWQINV